MLNSAIDRRVSSTDDRPGPCDPQPSVSGPGQPRPRTSRTRFPHCSDSRPRASRPARRRTDHCSSAPGQPVASGRSRRGRFRLLRRCLTDPRILRTGQPPPDQTAAATAAQPCPAHHHAHQEASGPGDEDVRRPPSRGKARPHAMRNAASSEPSRATFQDPGTPRPKRWNGTPRSFLKPLDAAASQGVWPDCCRRCRLTGQLGRHRLQPEPPAAGWTTGRCQGRARTPSACAAVTRRLARREGPVQVRRRARWGR